jgi:cobalt/nickel transport system ATP-binding protein
MAAAVGAQTAFRLESVRYAYPGGQRALDDITLEIREGERAVLLGANGCGKSTLIKLLNGLIFADSGRCEAFGEPLSAERLSVAETSFRFRRRVGFVFQNSEAQLFSPIVRDELAFAPLQMRLPEETIRQRIEDVSRLLRIESLLDRAPYSLSGGEKKKVAIACTLTANPDALLLDEPTNGLDPRSREELTRLLERLHLAGKTLVIATHDLSLASRLGDRCFVLSEDHRLSATGAPGEILSDAALLRSANLIA